jgi:hypothetical protein
MNEWGATPAAYYERMQFVQKNPLLKLNESDLTELINCIHSWYGVDVTSVHSWYGVDVTSVHSWYAASVTVVTTFIHALMRFDVRLV